MSYRMTEITDFVRAGKRSDGSLDVEVWETANGWRPDVRASEDMPECIIIPAGAVDALFEYLR
jgi:predicted nucleotidyltransferase